MKQLLDQVKVLLKDKIYVICLLLTIILGYGFAITHPTIGVDDFCFDRYVNQNYMLSADRFGTWGVYNIFQIERYSPFWLEVVVCIILTITALVITSVIQIVTKDKLNKYSYIIFSTVYISFPILTYFYSYQTTNFSIAISNLIMIIASYNIYYNFIENKRKFTYLIPIVMVCFAISCYQSCIQTFIAMCIIIAFLHLKYIDKKISLKKILCFGSYCLIVLMLGIVLFFVINSFIRLILFKSGQLVENGTSRKTIFSLNNSDKYLHTRSAFFTLFISNKNGVNLFTILIIIFNIIVFIDSIRYKEWKYILLSIILVLSNFIFMFLVVELLYRAYYSWAILQAFQVMYISEFVLSIKNNKMIEKILIVLCTYLVFHQTYIMNQLFYKNYIDEEASKRIALNIGNIIVSQIENYEQKKIIFIKEEGRLWNDFDEVVVWSCDAFHEKGVELTKYINHFGFDFVNAEKEEYEAFYKQYKNANKINNFIYDTEEYIYVVV